MQTVYLKHFVEVAEKGSISAAAAANFISPQGMSRSISVLENDLGCKLLRKTHSGMVLTEFGNALLDSAREILRIEQNMGERISTMKTTQVTTEGTDVLLFLNNAAFDSALFAPLVTSLEDIFSNACYFQKDNADIVDALIAADEEERDVTALGMLCLFSIDPQGNAQMIERLHEHGFDYQPYLESYDEVLVPANSLLAEKQALSKADILSMPIVSSGGDILKVCETLFSKRAIYMVTTDSTFRFRMVESGKAITFVPAFHRIVAEDNTLTRVVPMKDPYFLEIGFAAKREVFDNSTVQKVFAQLNDYYSNYASSPCIQLASNEITAISDKTAVPATSADGGFVSLQAKKYGFSVREIELLPELLAGTPHRTIADVHTLSIATVKSHIYHIYQKAGVHSQAELIALLSENGTK